MSGTAVETSGNNPLARFDADTRAKFLMIYGLSGQIQRSAREAGISPTTVRAHIKKNPDFAEAVGEALNDYKESIETELQRRALMGWEENVFQQGILAGTIRKYDSRLLELLVKRHIPEYKEKFEHTHNVEAGILAVPAAESKQVWEEQNSATELTEDEDGTFTEEQK